MKYRVLPNKAGSFVRRLVKPRGKSAVPVLFDAHWYVLQYERLIPRGMRPYDHYISQGAVLGLDPNPFFSTNWYLQKNPDVLAEGFNPLQHYLEHGIVEGREPSPLFNAAWYLEQYPDVAEAGFGALEHYLFHGHAEGRDPNGWFDTRWHLAQNPDIEAAGMHAYDHFLRCGAHEGRNPSPLFWTDWYTATNPDITSKGVNPFVHFLTDGIEAGLAPSPYFSPQKLTDYHIVKRSGMFDREFYYARAPDVILAGYDPLVHFVQQGASELRDPHPEFGIQRYIIKHQKALAGGVNPLVHYLLNRKEGDEGCEPAPLFAQRQELWVTANGPAWRDSFEQHLAKRLAARRHASETPIFGDGVPTFSLTTTVYNTAPEFLFDLADTIEAQLFCDFEWIILDNGSTDPNSRSAIQAIADRDSRFRLIRTEHNLHIIGGNRFAFERASGHYIVPIDSDDLLYPDSLALIADVLRRDTKNPPAVIYSDEQKVDQKGNPLELIWRWDFSTAHAMQTAPAAHLLVFSRAAGEQAGVYSDDYARGSHDWDTLLRLSENGADVVHIPEVLYGWRVHAHSTAGDASAKDYIASSQREVLRASLRRRELMDLFEIRELFDGVLGWYRLQRRRHMLPEIEIDFVVPFDATGIGALAKNVKKLGNMPAWRRVLYPQTLADKIEKLRSSSKIDRSIDEWVSVKTQCEFVQAINAVRTNTFAKAIITSSAEINNSDAVIEAVGVLELDRRAGIVGGPLIHRDGSIQNIGLLAGLDNFVGTPFFCWPVTSCPPHLVKACRPVCAFPVLAVCIRAKVLREGAVLNGVDYDDAQSGMDFCLETAKLGFSTILDERFGAHINHGLRQFVGSGTSWRSKMLAQNNDIVSYRGFSSHLTSIGTRFGRLADQGETSTSVICTLSPAIPLNLRVSSALDDMPTINLMLPAVRKESLSGGPNTALNIAYRLAASGYRLRIISTDLPPGQDLDIVWDLMMDLSGVPERLRHVEIVDGSDRSHPLMIGSNDCFFATAWWTAVMAQAASPLLGGKPFLYLIQDFEPIFYPASSHYALALETYSFPHIPVINTQLLRDYLVENGIGKFADHGHVANALTFEPALDRTVFYPSDESLSGQAFVAPKPLGKAQSKHTKKRRLLFYARPSVGVRNLFEIGLAALTAAVDQHIIDADNWEILGMGEQFAPCPLGNGAMLECAPWLGFAGYAEQMRSSDILLSLMLSPHPSYPPLEMASCGGLVVTNSYANKTPERLAALSANIIAADATVASIVEALRLAVGCLDDVDARHRAAELDLPASWDEAFSNTIPKISNRLLDLGLHQVALAGSVIDEPANLRLPAAELGSDYANFLAETAKQRARFNLGTAEAGLFTFVTTVWNTAPAYLEVLAKSLERQIGGTNFTWFILDNGSTRTDTRAMLDVIAARSYVWLERVEDNLGIINGMRYCLERAEGRYILPLDSDDYIFPDCISTLAWYVHKHDYPALLYTDEDKLIGERLSTPFQKPPFDPVLFSVQCYIAHLCVIDRERALALGVYSDPRTEGSHDWDTFTRFHNAGHIPVHVPHILYSWRLHAQSTAGGNMETKPVVFESQRAVLERMRGAVSAQTRFSVEQSPLFGNTPDWWWKRKRIKGRPITSIVVHTKPQQPKATDPMIAEGLDYRLIEMNIHEGLARLQALVAEAAKDSRLVHLLFSEAHPDDDEWAWEAIGQFDLHPDAVGIGGRLYDNSTIVDAGQFLGFGSGCDSPDRGRPLADPGYSAQMWKQRSVDSVPIQHAVFKADFLKNAIGRAMLFNASIAQLSAWIGGCAAETGARIIYSPFFCARTTLDLAALVSPRDKGMFLAAHVDIIAERNVRPPNFGRAFQDAYEPRIAKPYQIPAGIELPPYQEWLTNCEAVLVPRVSEKTLFFSILTTLYSGTDAGFFEQTAESVLRQSFDSFEWVILAHGPVPATVRTILEKLANDKRVRVLSLQENLGIIGGMRYVLEAGRGSYVVPLDGDDLLTADALAAFAAALSNSAEPPTMIYSDEDIVMGDALQMPYRRPSWDPVLDLENSWIWHLVAMDRSRALELNVYGDPGAEYCHDWDSVERFVAAGERIVHVPRVLCHWRHHARSTSNSGDLNNLSTLSTRNVLTRKIQRLGMTNKAVLAPYPIWRGTEEWWIDRLPVELPQMVAVTGSDVRAPIGFDVKVLTDMSDHNALANCIASLKADAIVAVISNDLEFSEFASLEVVKLFDFVSDVAIACGPIVSQGIINSAGISLNSAGRLHAPFDGQDESYSGPYALGLKPHSIAAPPEEAFFVRAKFLVQALTAAPRTVGPKELGLWLGAYAASNGRRVAYSPLLRAQSALPLASAWDMLSTQLAWNAFGEHFGIDAIGNQSVGGYWPMRWKS